MRTLQAAYPGVKTTEELFINVNQENAWIMHFAACAGGWFNLSKRSLLSTGPFFTRAQRVLYPENFEIFKALIGKTDPKTLPYKLRKPFYSLVSGAIDESTDTVNWALKTNNSHLLKRVGLNSRESAVRSIENKKQYLEKLQKELGLG